MTIPFRMAVSEFSYIEGLLHFNEDTSDDGLLLEFYHKESVLNVFGSRLKEVRIPIGKIGSVEHKSGWFSDKLAIRFRSLSDAEAIPGSRQGQVVLKCKKKERSKLSGMAVDLQLAMSQHRLDALESE